MRLYVSIFRNSKIIGITRYGDAMLQMDKLDIGSLQQAYDEA